MSKLILDGGGTTLKIFLKDNQSLKRVSVIKDNFNFQSGNTKKILSEIIRVIKKNKSEEVLIGLAGLNTTSDKLALKNDILNRLLKNQSPKKLVILSDIELQFEINFASKDGMIVILGTGSVFAAKSSKKIIKVGGYGKIIGDVGSGHTIGQKAIKLYLNLLDGFFIDKKFEHDFIKLFPTKNDVIRKIYKEDYPIASLSSMVMKLAKKGSQIAEKILFDESDEVIRYMIQLRNKLKRKNLPLKLTGGLVERKNYYSLLLQNKLKENNFILQD